MRRTYIRRGQELLRRRRWMEPDNPRSGHDSENSEIEVADLKRDSGTREVNTLRWNGTKSFATSTSGPYRGNQLRLLPRRDGVVRTAERRVCRVCTLIVEVLSPTTQGAIERSSWRTTARCRASTDEAEVACSAGGAERSKRGNQSRPRAVWGEMASTPRNSATGPLVTWPATVFTPWAKALSRRTASAAPWVATSWM
jgi:hypothetical protein